MVRTRRRPRQPKPKVTIKLDAKSFAEVFCRGMSTLALEPEGDLERLLFSSLLVDAAKDAGGGSFPYYIARHCEKMDDKDLVLLYEKLPKGDAREYVAIEMRERIEKRQAAKTARAEAQAEAQDSTKH